MTDGGWHGVGEEKSCVVQPHGKSISLDPACHNKEPTKLNRRVLSVYGPARPSASLERTHHQTAQKGQEPQSRGVSRCFQRVSLQAVLAASTVGRWGWELAGGYFRGLPCKDRVLGPELPVTTFCSQAILPSTQGLKACHPASAANGGSSCIYIIVGGSRKRRKKGRGCEGEDLPSHKCQLHF